MRFTISLVLILSASAPAWSQARALPKVIVSARPTPAPAGAFAPRPGFGAPRLGSILPAPRISRPLAADLAAPSLLQNLSASVEAAPVLFAPGSEPEDGLASAMTLQSSVLGMLSRATGFDPLVFSLGMAVAGNGLTVLDWNKLGAGLQEIDSDWGELEQVLGAAVRSPNFSEGFRQGKKIQPEDMGLLGAVLKELPREVEIKRNNHYLGWLYKWQDGDSAAAGASFKGGTVRRVQGGWLIALGAIAGPAGAEPLRVTLADLPGMPADAKPQMDKLLASPLLTAEQRADLLELAANLEAAKLLPAGYASSRG